ncbi:outer membrane protein assembly factor BamC [Pantoea sp. Aalb]|uniref:outer membrane protein assembly factor BamC n=1 Tax=Pantoea sp. Aalb TaxID=2576762 RepID=UPI00132A24C3|nr:outer membrane protein assembly factor BamC [Pantoea sp. Aalb]MXP67270.1 outer membrane protein assembly factor BamC [Pantoea sp. Aalb]
MYLFKRVTLVFCTLILLSSCFNEQNYSRKFSTNESYLQTFTPYTLKIPKGITLPLKNEEYDIPNKIINGPLGKKLDIRPPKH